MDILKVIQASPGKENNLIVDCTVGLAIALADELITQLDKPLSR